MKNCSLRATCDHFVNKYVAFSRALLSEQTRRVIEELLDQSTYLAQKNFDLLFSEKMQQ